MQIGDSFSLGDTFNEEIAIKVTDETQGLNGACMVYSKEPVDGSVKYYKSSKPIFIKNQRPASVIDTEAGGDYMLGYYNENAEYDVKGSLTTVMESNGFLFSITQNTIV